MSRDLRKYAQQTNARLLVGFILLLLIVGLGLIYIFYGFSGAMMGFICLVAGLAPLGLIAVALWAMEWLVKRGHDE